MSFFFFLGKFIFTSLKNILIGPSVHGKSISLLFIHHNNLQHRAKSIRNVFLCLLLLGALT